MATNCKNLNSSNRYKVSDVDVALITDLPSKFYGYNERTDEVQTTGPDVVYLSLLTGDLEAGNYLISSSWICRNSSAIGDWIIDITEGVLGGGLNTSLLNTSVQEEGIDPGADQRYARTISIDHTFIAGQTNINLELSQSGSGTASLFFGNLRIFKVQ